MALDNSRKVLTLSPRMAADQFTRPSQVDTREHRRDPVVSRIHSGFRQSTPLKTLVSWLRMLNSEQRTYLRYRWSDMPNAETLSMNQRDVIRWVTDHGV